MTIPLLLSVRNRAQNERRETNHIVIDVRQKFSANKWLLLILVATSIVYWAGLSGPFLHDDVPNLTGNTYLVIDPGVFDEWRSASLSSNAGIFTRWVSMLSFAVNHSLSGFDAFSFKLTNLIIHLLITLEIYLFCLLLLRTPALERNRNGEQRDTVIALVAAAIWALHPLHVSTVLYVVQRMAQLSTFFVLAGLLVFLHYRLRWATKGWDAAEVVTATLWILLAGGLALFSKENGILLLWLLPVIEVSLFHGRIGGLPNSAFYRLAWLAVLSPVIIVAVGLALDPAYLYAGFNGREFTMVERLLTQSRVLLHYLGWFFWPDIQSMVFHHDGIVHSKSVLEPLSTLSSLIFWSLSLICAWLLRARLPLFLFTLLFFLVAQSMESSFLPLQMVFEHRNYLPSVALSLAFAYALVGVSQQVPSVRIGFLLGAPLLTLVLLTGARSAIWSDELDLARFNALHAPQSARTNFIYGQALYGQVLSGTPENMGEEKRKQLILSARNHFKRMYELAPRDFAGLVRLHQLDSTYFPSMSEGRQWMSIMILLAETRRLQESDKVALEALADFSIAKPSSESFHDVQKLFQVLTERYPHNQRLAFAQYKLLANSEEASNDSLLVLLESARRNNPSDVQSHFAVARYYIPQSPGSAFIAIGEGLRRDSLRRQLISVKRLFEQ
ncbi:MAG: hypothetical protein V7720_02455 [Halioglobus sp.]